MTRFHSREARWLSRAQVGAKGCCRPVCPGWAGSLRSPAGNSQSRLVRNRAIDARLDSDPATGDQLVCHRIEATIARPNQDVVKQGRNLTGIPVTQAVDLHSRLGGIHPDDLVYFLANVPQRQ